MPEPPRAPPGNPDYPVRLLQGHRRRVCTVGWSCNGKKLASGSEDQTVKIWAVEPAVTNKVEKADVEFKGHTESVVNLAWHPKRDDQLASLSDKTIRIWDTRSKTCAATINHSANLYLAWHPDGSQIAVATKDDTVAFVDTRKFKVLKTAKMHSEVNEVGYLPSGQQLLVTTGRGSVEVMNLPNLESVCSLQGHAATCLSIAVSGNQRYLASGGGDALVSLWDLEHCVCVHTTIGVDMPIRSLSFNNDSSYLAFAVERSNIEIVEVPTGIPVHTINLQDGSDSCTWNPKHHILAYTADDTREGLGSIGVLLTPQQRR
eukprot:jgi/Chrzof1/12130/Cz06g22100.t1